MTSELQPGLLILHGNRFELLRDAVFEWLARHPLAPLEEEVFLVQSNGMSDWLKMGLAQAQGVCAATQVELPARFLWRAFRQQFGAAQVPRQSPLDRHALLWRLMALLPQRMGERGWEPLARYLEGQHAMRRFQLCQRLASLFDQYQVYRGDWLDAWAAGQDVLIGAQGERLPLPAEQAWQALLWRDLLAPLSAAERAATRPAVHRRFLAALAAGEAPCRPMPRRVVMFGASHLPLQSLQALAALAERAQVLVAVPNPCRYQWSDIFTPVTSGLRRRQPARGGLSLGALPPEELQAHAHPLLAAWGRQGGDFIRELDAFDDALLARERFAVPKVDLFDETEGASLLNQVQAHIRDLLPLAEHPKRSVSPDDRSIVFHMAHSIQREVEILHDQLLGWLDGRGREQPLQPRDVVVMVPDIEQFAASVRAVFGQYPRHDPRFIPFDIADTQERANDPLMVALDWLLQLPVQRCRLTEVRDLLDVPALARRFGIAPEDLPRAGQWLREAGVRWGLDGAQRAALDLGACGERNSWVFGLRRMLAGYACGEPAPGEAGVAEAAESAFAHIEPYAEVAGLEAALAGSLADLVAALIAWQRAASRPATPLAWAELARGLLDSLLAPAEESERLSLAALHEALSCWLESCAAADFTEAIPLAVFREAWLSGLADPGLGRRFLSGGVTFCTLMPLRSIPFELVCLLGMNDGDFPRAGSAADFDLMAWPGQARPGDRSRRDDDRQLMLEALLSARRALYLSWTGRSLRDNSALPPSVLVAQLRDYLAAGWSGDVLAQRTLEHPLQPFSRRYFSAGSGGSESGLFTHAREWRAAHLPPSEAVAPPVAALAGAEESTPVDLNRLAGFLRNPVKDLFRHRWQVVFSDRDELGEDEEPFGLNGLESHAFIRELLMRFNPNRAEDAAVVLSVELARLQRAGHFQMAELGERERDKLAAEVLPMLRAWQGLHADADATAQVQGVQFEAGASVLLDELMLWPTRAAGTLPHWRELSPSKLCEHVGRKTLRGELLLAAWVRSLALGACGVQAAGVLIGRDARVDLPPLPVEFARDELQRLLHCFEAGRQQPLPVACRTALAWLHGGPEAAESAYEGDEYHGRGEVREPCLARAYPDYAALSADARFGELAEALYAGFRGWLGRLPVHLHAQDEEQADAE